MRHPQARLCPRASLGIAKCLFAKSTFPIECLWGYFARQIFGDIWRYLAFPKKTFERAHTLIVSQSLQAFPATHTPPRSPLNMSTSATTTSAFPSSTSSVERGPSPTPSSSPSSPAGGVTDEEEEQDVVCTFAVNEWGQKEMMNDKRPSGCMVICSKHYEINRVTTSTFSTWG